MKEDQTQVLHRFEDRWYAARVDEFDTPIGKSSCQIQHRTFPIVRKTKQGFWILTGYIHLDSQEKNRQTNEKEFETLRKNGGLRWVSTKSKKRFAHEGEREALESYIARKERQSSIYRARARNADEALNLGKTRLEKMKDKRD